ncbi:SAM-dependent methyltransferase [Halorhodospira halochloris]|uniref:SAM-dependent methyltransferase n=2 Tax=Halorhodospira halochloris TaxID=1052 RepID=A0A120MZQ6_HALHR|nr:methyltransferase domain-containing protein [Halorhodospira halochloris]MBK1652862.1 hypothetical protein [Halorhodospira halochloris]BAU57341.1 SAM-dependent methyltransferase [Halorhodospira halochloris]
MLANGKSMHMLRQWYQTPLGCRVAEAERAALSAELSALRIGYAVCIGDLNDGLSVAPTLRQWQGGEAGDLIFDPSRLPFQAQSLDCLILRHVLELVEEPQAVLHEAHQVLRPEGKLLVLSFNPLGPWGVARLIGHWRGAEPPWCGRQWLATAIAMRLRQIGFADITVQFICHRLPVQRSSVQQRFDCWESWVRRLGAGRANAAVQMVAARRRTPAGLSGLVSSRLARGRQEPGAAQPASGRQGWFNG